MFWLMSTNSFGNLFSDNHEPKLSYIDYPERAFKAYKTGGDDLSSVFHNLIKTVSIPIRFSAAPTV